MSCVGCKDGAGFDLPITMAFQPIVNVSTQTVFAYEALVRGKDGAGAGQVLAQIADHNRYAFDQVCRTTAIELAAGLDMAATGANLSINFLPNAVYEPRACIRATLAAAMRTGFPVNKIIFEFTESEAMDADHILNILRSYRAMGFKTAIDDFGAGYAGLGLLTLFQPDIVKLDMALIRDIDTDPVKRTIVRNTLNMLRDLGVEPVCEGIETPAEQDVLRDLGVDLMQGYLLARPALEALGLVAWPRAASLARTA
ncbi:MAG: EAL domain-containing protein [Brevundimonas aurantiaca]|jgi:EAL domain-containing protein (putative c-di-GMP-specific phosphodiesterase class I)|uniref:EAL domain-containing protein n=1 Tax=Brevundimonas TaxID=41275 RepID=UPI000EC00FAB|nr:MULTISPECIES: EAL domain-containing protein [Brevundimonas]MBA4786409.1 EAL domain-containing protein [Brevundimonas sp.]MCC4293651.1 EAL domain-containing protein [Brevundimonas aurantiaca]QFU31601.1 Blue light- and temperature-regulated antirepressor YcgF [Brevundimonas sp. Bb-A]HAF80926.1 diguanylate phosphodiesterase [Brevundimonas sp.]